MRWDSRRQASSSANRWIRSYFAPYTQEISILLPEQFMRRRIVATAGLVVLTLSLAGCDLVDPCDLSEEQPNDNALDRRWRIATVNGAGIPAAGVNIPGSSDRLVFGTLHFQTIGKLGNCFGGGRVRDEGRVIAVYNIVNSAGQSKGTKTYAGAFEYDHESGAVTLKADKKSITGQRVINDLSFFASIPFLGAYTVVFVKVS